MAAKIIAFLNFKGGVGKTTCVVNLGACLAYLLGRRVLVVDLDAQCNSTFWLLRPREFLTVSGEAAGLSGRRRTAWQIYDDALQGTSLFDASASILRGVPRDERGIELAPYLHLLPGARYLSDLEFGVGNSEVQKIRPALLKALRPLRPDYDYILLDCPPNLHGITQSAELAADHIVVPYNPDFLSLSGFRELCRELRRRRGMFREHRPQRPDPTLVSAVLVCRHMLTGGAYGTAIAELESTLDLLKEERLVGQHCVRLAPPIRHDVKVSESVSAHRPVIFHAPTSNATNDFMQLAGVFARHFDSLP